MPRMRPLEKGEYGELEEPFAQSEQAVGFVTNHLRIMARRPGITKAFMNLFTEIMVKPGTVPTELKYLCGYMSSASAGCMYCSVHTANASIKKGYGEDRFKEVWNYETSDAFSDAEKAAIRFAQLAGQVPNGVTDEDFEEMKKYYSEDQIVEILSAIAVYGFLTRFNDSIATPMEDHAVQFGEKVLAPSGWEVGKHRDD